MGRQVGDFKGWQWLEVQLPGPMTSNTLVVG